MACNYVIRKEHNIAQFYVMRTFFNDPKKDKQVKQGTTAYLKFPVESEGSDLLSFLKSRVSKRTSLEIRGFLQFEGVLVVVIIT